MTPEKDISGWKNNKNFLKWMAAINPSLDKEDILLISEEQWIGGWCEDFALYFAIRWNVPMLFLAHEHDLVKIDGKYYDGADIHGKKRLQDMQFVREHDSLYRLAEEELEKLLIVDEDWKGYRPLASKVGLIERMR